MRQRAGSSSVGSEYDAVGASRTSAPTITKTDFSFVMRSPTAPVRPKLWLLQSRLFLPRFADLRPFRVGVLRQTDQRRVVARRFRPITGGLCRFCRPVIAAQAFAGVLHGRLILLERVARASLLHQHVPQKLAHWVQPVLHRDMLLARILKVGRGAHEL